MDLTPLITIDNTIDTIDFTKECLLEKLSLQESNIPKANKDSVFDVSIQNKKNSMQKQIILSMLFYKQSF